MMDRAEQYEFILDHYQNPRNRGEMPDADVYVQGGLPGCSDLVTIYLKFDGDRISEISFVGEGCTISQAAASALTEEVKGMTAEEVRQLDFQFMSDLMGEEIVQTRPRCATVSLDTLKAAIEEHRRKLLSQD